jgi:hypothetical protein
MLRNAFEALATEGKQNDLIALLGAGPVAVAAAPVVSTTPYSAGDVVGTRLQFANMARGAGLGGLLQSLVLTSKSNISPEFDLVLFNAQPVTVFADNAPLVLEAADLAKIAQVLTLTPDDWHSLGTPCVAQASPLALSYRLSATTMYGILVARSVFSLASVSDLGVTLTALVA